MNGVSARRFNPNGNITREQIAAILYRYEGGPKVNGTLAAFPDSGDVHPYAVNALIWATGEGLINGIKSGIIITLESQNNATCAQIVSIIMRNQES